MSTTAEQGSELRTERTTAKRHPERSTHEFATIARILDEGIYCHIGFSIDTQPFVVPTAYGREGRALYIHGSAASRALRSLSEGLPLCLTVTLFDGLVLARSGFHSSINYRSVVIHGNGRKVTDAAERLAALKAFVEKLTPGRWAELRPPTEQELKATTVIAVPSLAYTPAISRPMYPPPMTTIEDGISGNASAWLESRTGGSAKEKPPISIGDDPVATTMFSAA